MLQDNSEQQHTDISECSDIWGGVSLKGAFQPTNICPFFSLSPKDLVLL